MSSRSPPRSSATTPCSAWTTGRERHRGRGERGRQRRSDRNQALDLRHDELPWSSRAGRPDGPLAITANLLRPLLLELAGRLPEQPAELIAGGLLREEADEVSAALAAGGGLRERRRLEDGDWAALWLSSG